MSKAIRVGVALLLAAGLAFQAKGQALHAIGGEQVPAPDTAASGTSSTSRAENENARAVVSGVVPAPVVKHGGGDRGPVRPFSSVAVSAQIGTFGIGGQIATPISRWLNLRAATDFLNFGYGLKIDGATYEGEAHLHSGRISADFFPFRTGFHVSPTLMIFDSGFSASVYVPGGNSFDLDNATFTSSITDPIHGSAALIFPNKVMPALTFGFSNMIAREGRHWSVPVEFGLAYTGHYTAQLNLQGTACVGANCQSTATSDIQGDVQGEQDVLNEATKHYQIYPILTGGISYRF